MRLLKKTAIALSVISLYSPSFAATNTDAFAELDQATAQVNRSPEEIKKEFHAYVSQRLDEYEKWREEYTKDLDKQREVLIEQWGSAQVSDQTTEVEYSENDTVRKVVDYANNTATISILVDGPLSEEQSKQLLEKQALLPDGEKVDLENAELVQQAVDYSAEQESKEKAFVLEQTQAQMNQYDVQAERLISANTGIADDFIYQRAYDQKMALLAEAKQRVLAIKELYQSQRKAMGLPEPEAKPLVEEKTSQVEPEVKVAPKSEPKIAESKVAESKTVASKTAVAPPVAKATKKVVSYKINLPNNSLAARASQYQPMALEQSDKWSVDPALVMAIMHSESAFRPKAKSHVPAFGLMQIVPSSAGRDVNKQVRNIDAPMKIDDLYQPPINVETGTAYLHILNSKYLKTIKDDESRLYCTIAAYNTGAGNVARAFNSDRSTNIRKASEVINQLSPQQVYDQLIRNLPYDETKNYLKKVSSRMDLYQSDGAS